LGKNIVISGAGRGLGLCILKEHLRLGDSVFALYRTKTTGLSDLKKTYPETLYCCKTDVCETVSVQKAATACGKLFKQVDVVYNNAGIDRPENRVPLEKTDIDELLVTYNINAAGAVRIMKSFFPYMKDGTVIINISSKAGSISLSEASTSFGYRMSKAAMNMATKLFSNYTKDMGIRILSICPGWIRTDMGGSEAPLTPEDSAKKIVAITQNITQISPDIWYINTDRQIYTF